MKQILFHWQFWALLSAFFASLTAIFAKIGIRNINSDCATFIRTIIILIFTTLFLLVTKQFQSVRAITTKNMIFLVLSGAAACASWLAYFRALSMGNVSQVAPIDKLSIVFVAILGCLILKEHLSIINWCGITLIGIGAMLIGIR